MRPAALRRGASPNAMRSAVIARGSMPATVAQRRDAGARARAHAREAVGDERAVLVEQRHDVGDGAERGEVGELAPGVRVPETRADGRDQLERDARARELGEPALPQLRVAHGHAHRDALAGLVMVGDDDVDPGAAQARDLVRRGDAAVDGDNQRRRHRDQTIHRRVGQAVALAEPVRDGGLDVGAERGEPAAGERRGRQAVDVEVAEHHDARLRADGRGHGVGARGHPGQRLGVAPVAREVRRQERADRLPGCRCRAPAGRARRCATGPSTPPGRDRRLVDGSQGPARG